MPFKPRAFTLSLKTHLAVRFFFRFLLKDILRDTSTFSLPHLERPWREQYVVSQKREKPGSIFLQICLCSRYIDSLDSHLPPPPLGVGKTNKQTKPSKVMFKCYSGHSVLFHYFQYFFSVWCTVNCPPMLN